MSRARSVSQLVGANTSLGNTTISGALSTGNTVITGTANVSSTLAAGNTTIMGTGYIQVTNATSYTTSTRVGSGLTVYNNSITNSYAGIELLTEPTTGNAGICGIAGLSTGSGDSALVFGTRGSSTYAERMRIDASGRVTMPFQPCFFAFNTTDANLSSGNKISFQSAPVNIGSHYNTSTSRFTAPIAGRYLFQSKVQFASGSAGVYAGIVLTLNGATYSESYASQYTTNAHIVPVVCAILQLNAGDYVEIITGSFAGSVPTVQGSNERRTIFMGYLLG